MQLLYPLKNIFVTQRYGERPEVYNSFGLSSHNGIDFRAATGTEIFAAQDGFVKLVEDQGNKAYGLHIRLQHAGQGAMSSYETEYSHLQKAVVSKGQQVKAGQLIAYSNNSGFSSAAHLHFGLRMTDQNGNPVALANGNKGWIDPQTFLVEKLSPNPLPLDPWQLNAVTWIQSTQISSGERPLDQITRVEVFELLRKYHEYLKSQST